MVLVKTISMFFSLCTVNKTHLNLSILLQSSINDSADFKAVNDAMRVIGFTAEEIQTVYKILATILHLV